MDTIGWIVAGAAIAGLAYYGYRQKNNPKNPLDKIIINTPAEHVSHLSLSDIKTYFKGLQLQNTEDSPILKRTHSGGRTSYFLAVYHKSTKNLTHIKHLQPDTVDPEIERILGDKDMVVLS
jgi:hypothetical protein